MDLYAELVATKPEIEQQLKLIVEYRQMLRNINKKHMEKQIKVELQTKILKQHKDRYKSRIDLSEAPPKIDPDLDKTGAHFREEQQGTKQVDGQIRLEEEHKLSSESFEQSKKDALNLVTPKIEKFTKDDKNRQGLKCSFTGCYFTTSATLKKCKARKQIKQHEENNG